MSDTGLSRGKRGKSMGHEMSQDEVNLTRRRLEFCQLCSTERGRLVVKHIAEPFTMQTPIGGLSAPLVTFLVCENCGLVYWWPVPPLPPGSKGEDVTP